MSTAQYAIMIGPQGAAWEWRLVDTLGAVVAAGRAATLPAAIEIAQDMAGLDRAQGNLRNQGRAVRPTRCLVPMGIVS